MFNTEICLHTLRETGISDCIIASEAWKTCFKSFSQHPFSSARDEVIFIQPDYHCRHEAINFTPLLSFCPPHPTPVSIPPSCRLPPPSFTHWWTYPQDSLSCILKSAGFASLSKQWETSARGRRSLDRVTGRGLVRWTGLAYARVP